MVQSYNPVYERQVGRLQFVTSADWLSMADIDDLCLIR